jgi:MFS family permease
MHNHEMLLERKSYEESPSEIASQGIGLMTAVGLIIGAIIGALLANAYLDTSLGTEAEFLIGALAGAGLGVVASTLVVRALTKKIEQDFD